MTRLNEIRERLEAATPGPWEVLRTDNEPYGVMWEMRGPKVKIVFGCSTNNCGEQDGLPPKSDDVAFIAHAPADIAWLLEAVRLGNEMEHDLLWGGSARLTASAYRAHVAEQPDAKASTKGGCSHPSSAVHPRGGHMGCEGYYCNECGREVTPPGTADNSTSDAKADNPE